MVDYRRANEPHLSSGLAKTMPLDKYLERDTVVDNRRANEPHLASDLPSCTPLDEYMASDGVCSGISIRAPQMVSEEFLTPVHWRQKFLSIELMAFVVSCGRKETTARWLQAKYCSSGARNRAPLDQSDGVRGISDASSLASEIPQH